MRATVEVVLAAHQTDEYGSCYCGVYVGGAAHQAQVVVEALASDAVREHVDTRAVGDARTLRTCLDTGESIFVEDT